MRLGPVVMRTRLLTAVAVFACSIAPTMADGDEAGHAYKIEVAIVSLDGTILQGEAACSDGEWCNVRMGGNFSANVVKTGDKYRVSIHGVWAHRSSREDCCGIDGVNTETAEFDGSLDRFDGDLYFGPYRNDLVYHIPEKFGRFSALVRR